jgi:glycyl-tRNA synthetase
MEKDKENDNLMEKITSLAKRRGFVYQGSEIYGGLAGTWDYGPLGVALKNNIKEAWRKKFVSSRNNMYEVDAAILMNSKVWEASGHVSGFADPMVTCLECNAVFRTDQIIEKELVLYNLEKYYLDYQDNKISKEKDVDEKDKLTQEKEKIVIALEHIKDNENIAPEDTLVISNKIITFLEEQAKSKGKSEKNLVDFLNGMIDVHKYDGVTVQEAMNKQIACSNCKKKNWSNPRQFNMMFATKIGASEGTSSTAYLRPETAQGIFVNFKNIVDSFHPKLPFGIAQIGKAFRNEITPRDFLFRVREFEQLEVEYFIREDDADKSFTYWHEETNQFIEELGIDMTRVHEIEIPEEKRAHYSRRTTDFEFDFPFGQKELYGLVYRGSFDLTNHSLEYIDEDAKEKITPHVIEPSMGVDRLFLALLLSVYAEDMQGEETRSFLKFKPHMAPVTCAVSPLLKNKPELMEKAKVVYGLLKSEFGRVMWDDNGNIGKRYRRQDEIGTPWCIVIDFDTLTDDTVTIRDRDTGAQERIAQNELVEYIKERLY